MQTSFLLLNILNKRMHSITTLIAWSRVVHANLSMACICSPTNFLIASYTRANVVISYHHSIIHGCWVGLLTSTIKAGLTGKDCYFVTVWLPTILSWTTKVVVFIIVDFTLASLVHWNCSLADIGCKGSIVHSLLNTHHPIGLTIESDKLVCLLTRLYGMS